MSRPQRAPAGNDDDEPLAGTVKLYQRHLVVLTSTPDWPSHVDEQPGLAAALRAQVTRHGDQLDGVKVTVATGNQSARGHDVLVFPDLVRYREVGATASDLPTDAAALVTDQLLAGKVSPCLRSDRLTGRHLLVCVHGGRDERCGQHGPPLGDALQRALVKQAIDDVTVWRSSHLGGHRFAGCLVAYPSGDWYGRLQASLAEHFVERCLIAETILQAHWRGRLGQTPHQQVALAARKRTRRCATGAMAPSPRRPNWGWRTSAAVAA